MLPPVFDGAVHESCTPFPLAVAAVRLVGAPGARPAETTLTDALPGVTPTTEAITEPLPALVPAVNVVVEPVDGETLPSEGGLIDHAVRRSVQAVKEPLPNDRRSLESMLVSCGFKVNSGIYSTVSPEMRETGRWLLHRWFELNGKHALKPKAANSGGDADPTHRPHCGHTGARNSESDPATTSTAPSASARCKASLTSRAVAFFVSRVTALMAW